MVVEEKKESVKLVDKKYELVPPDGGWGYLVAISAIISFSTTTGFAQTFGMMYNDFIIEVSLNSAGVTLLSGIFAVAVALSGFFTSALLHVMSMRWLAFISCVAFAFGTLGTVIMTSPLMFYLTAGILQGIGLGVMYNLSCSIVNDYFVERRMLIMNFIQTATGINAMIAPIFVRWSLEQYGSRGTLLLIGGLSLHNFIAVLLMQPVRWHMKKVEVPVTTELKVLLDKSNDVKKLDTPVITLTDLESDPTKEDLAKALEFPENEEKKTGFRKILASLIDPTVIKTFLFSCAALGPATCSTADGVYMVMVPQYLYSMGWSQDSVAMAITLYGFGDLSMRVVFTIISKWMNQLGVQKIYIMGVVLAVMTRLGMLWSTSITAMMVYFTIMGVSHCVLCVLIPLVISDTVAPEKFTSAMGICLLVSGMISFVLGPSIGAIRDITNSYPKAFYALTSVYAFIAVLWLMELFIKSNILRRKIVKNFKSSQSNK